MGLCPSAPPSFLVSVSFTLPGLTWSLRWSWAAARAPARCSASSLLRASSFRAPASWAPCSLLSARRRPGGQAGACGVCQRGGVGCWCQALEGGGWVGLGIPGGWCPHTPVVPWSPSSASSSASCSCPARLWVRARSSSASPSRLRRREAWKCQSSCQGELVRGGPEGEPGGLGAWGLQVGSWGLQGGGLGSVSRGLGAVGGVLGAVGGVLGAASRGLGAVGGGPLDPVTLRARVWVWHEGGQEAVGSSRS